LRAMGIFCWKIQHLKLTMIHPLLEVCKFWCLLNLILFYFMNHNKCNTFDVYNENGSSTRYTYASQM
jgi:hypothetical protein